MRRQPQLRNAARTIAIALLSQYRLRTEERRHLARQRAAISVAKGNVTGLELPLTRISADLRNRF